MNAAAGWCCPALEGALAASALRAMFGPRWRVFRSTQGRWWATRGTSRAWADRPLGVLPDAVDADSPAELAARIRARS